MGVFRLRRRSHDQKPTPESPTPHPPEQVGVLGGTGCEHVPIGSDDLNGQQVINREAVFAHQPAYAPTQSESCQPGSRDITDGGGQPKCLGLAHKFADGEACLGPGDALHRIDLDAFHAGEIDDEAPIAGSVAREAMTTTTNSDGKVLTACELDSRDDIGNVGAADDQGRVLVYHPIPDPTGALIALVARADQFAVQTFLEVLKGISVYRYVKHMMYVSP